MEVSISTILQEDYAFPRLNLLDTHLTRMMISKNRVCGIASLVIMNARLCVMGSFYNLVRLRHILLVGDLRSYEMMLGFPKTVNFLIAVEWTFC